MTTEGGKHPFFTEAKKILLIGHSKNNNDYDRAKTPNSDNGKWRYVSEHDIEGCIKKGHWIGAVLPPGYIVVDIDSKEKGVLVFDGLSQSGYAFGAIKTPRGYQFIFKDIMRVPRQRSKFLTLCGVMVDYRLPGKGYIVSPSENTPGREIINYPEKPLDPMPLCFIPVRLKKETDEETDRILKGFRDNALLSHASRIGGWDKAHRLNLSNEDKRQALSEVNQIFCYPPLSERDIDRIGSSAERYATSSTPAQTPEPHINNVRALSIGELLTASLPPREDILSPWLPTQGLALCNAYRGVGKTLFAVGVTVAVASGGNFLKIHSPKPRGVLYIDGELPGHVIQRRFSGEMTATEKEITAPLKIITPDFQPFGMPNLATVEGQQSIDPCLEGIELVIIDNISTLCRGGRENDAESWGVIQEWALRLRSQGISVLFMHHTGKNGLQRGTSKREDVLDTVIYLKHPTDYTPDKGAWFEVHFDKARGIYGDDTKSIDVQLETDPAGVHMWTVRDLEDSLTVKVASLLNEGIPQKEISEMLGIAKGTVSKHKNKAKMKGLLSDEN
jgi:hypothetical protein